MGLNHQQATVTIWDRNARTQKINITPKIKCWNIKDCGTFKDGDLVKYEMRGKTFLSGLMEV